ncbi:MAG: flagellar basal body-associated protein FliL [Aliishimia sp.]
MRKLLPILLLLIGTGTGIGAGVFLRPAPMPMEEGAKDMEAADGEKAAMSEEDPMDPEEPNATREYVKLNNQFVIPIVEDGIVASLVVISISVEVKPGYREAIFSREPKIRDSFLQVMFDHANVGGFQGAFTDNSMLDVLRASLRSVAKRDAGDHVTDVLILEIARQDY